MKISQLVLQNMNNDDGYWDLHAKYPNGRNETNDVGHVKLVIETLK